MKRLTLSLLAGIALAAPLALNSPSAMASPETPPAHTAKTPVTVSDTQPVPAPAPLQDNHLFDEEEMAALAALELEHAELQEQKAGFFGPSVGTVIIVALLVVLLL